MTHHLSRRELWKQLTLAGAAAALPAAELYGQYVNKSTAKGGRIDIHHHHSPPALRTGPGGRGRSGLGP